MKALDLFCGAGGASMGLYRAGFEVTGVDLHPQSNYPFEFQQGDAIDADLSGYDFVWASPPCQRHSSLQSRTGKEYDCFIDRTRARLKAWGGPYIIENVVRSPLINPLMLCGSSFGIGVRRHRLFESNVQLTGPACDHGSQPFPVDVTGTGGRRLGARLDGKGGNSRKPLNLAEAQAVMGIDWMSRKEISQSIPPAFSAHLGLQIMALLKPRKEINKFVIDS